MYDQDLRHITRPPPGSTLFPYTTLFRSRMEIPDRAHDRASLARQSRRGDFDDSQGSRGSWPRVWRSQLSVVSFQFSVLSFQLDRKSTRLNSSHPSISYAVFCLKKKTHQH